jgi:hypothetical protein
MNIYYLNKNILYAYVQIRFSNIYIQKYILNYQARPYGMCQVSHRTGPQKLLVTILLFFLVYVWFCSDKNWFWQNWFCRIDTSQNWFQDKVTYVLIWSCKNELNKKFKCKNHFLDQKLRFLLSNIINSGGIKH